jgi:geranylgeranyl diphosphate synthase type I
VNPALAPYLEAVEAEMRAVVRNSAEDLSVLYGMLLYHLGWLDTQLRPERADAGKRVRPLLCLLSCEAAGGQWRRAVPGAAALELVHNFSLLHDDIEDQSATRRGRATVWKVWGLAHGINSGDSLLILARLALGGLKDRGYGCQPILDATNLLDHTCLELCHGQYLDISGEADLGMTEERYLRMIGGKTAALLAASAEMGALLAGNAAEMPNYRQLGWNLGLAFQMVDDVLGIWGNPAVTGKPAGDDLLSRKMTLPVIHAMRSGPAGSELGALYRLGTWQDGTLRGVVELLERSGSRTYVELLAEHYQAQALEALRRARPAAPASGLLLDLVSSLTTRSK